MPRTRTGKHLRKQRNKELDWIKDQTDTMIQKLRITLRESVDNKRPVR